MSQIALVEPIVIIGAGRSGTTMLREALSAHPDLALCEYELNYLWRYGNSGLDHDMLDPDLHFSEDKARYIRAELTAILAESGKPRLVEKTVANVMRPRYVQTVLPDARFIHLIRDGRAVAASAMHRWQAKPGTSYLLSKAKTIPLRDLIRTGMRYVFNRLKGMTRKRNYIQSWGPRWPGIDSDVRELPLFEVCAKQWALSVATARKQKADLPDDRYLEIRYESLVNDPMAVFRKIAGFVGIDPEQAAFQNHITTQIRANGVDKWRSQLSETDLAGFNRQAGPLLEELGYS